jgi:hypothetical protein
MKSNKIVLKIIALLMVISLVMMFSGCSSEEDEEPMVVEYDIIAARYVNSNGNEKLFITYIDSNGEHKTDRVDMDYELEIGSVNQVVIIEPYGFWDYDLNYYLTAETYNEVVRVSPQYYTIE